MADIIANASSNASNIAQQSFVNQSLRMLEHEDTTMLALIQEVDGQMGQMKSSVLSAVASIRNKILLQASETLTQQRIAAQDQQDVLLAHTNRLQDQLDAKAALCHERQSTIERLVTHIQELKRKARADATVRSLFTTWRDKARKLAIQKRNAESLAQTSAIHHLRATFMNWRLRSATKKAAEQKDFYHVALQREAIKVDNEKRMFEAKWSMERLQLIEKLRAEEERRELLEQKLKAAFMRGVCALNMEAMSVLRGHDGIVSKDNDSVRAEDNEEISRHATTASSTQQHIDPISHVLNNVVSQGTNFGALVGFLNPALDTGTRPQPTSTAATHQPNQISSKPSNNEELFRKQMQLQQTLLSMEPKMSMAQHDDKENITHTSSSGPAASEKKLTSTSEKQIGITRLPTSAPNNTATQHSYSTPSSKPYVAQNVHSNRPSSSSAVAKRESATGSTATKYSAPSVSIPTSAPRSTLASTTPQNTYHVQRHTGVEVKVTMNPAYLGK